MGDWPKCANGVYCFRLPMVIIETSIFTRQVQELMTDDGYRRLQADLSRNPGAGAVVKGSGGLRKFRWAAKGRGKSGGVRIIYYWAVAQNRLVMLFIYPKSKLDDLSSEQLRALKKIIEEEYP